MHIPLFFLYRSKYIYSNVCPTVSSWLLLIEPETRVEASVKYIEIVGAETKESFTAV